VPDSAAKLVPGQLKLPVSVRSPWWELTRRLLIAVGILVGTVLLVYLDRASYRDGGDAGGRVGEVQRPGAGQRRRNGMTVPPVGPAQVSSIVIRWSVQRRSTTQ
jgi:hypothetical protein